MTPSKIVISTVAGIVLSIGIVLVLTYLAGIGLAEILQQLF